jgi:DNA-binding response OmpR family regulator
MEQVTPIQKKKVLILIIDDEAPILDALVDKFGREEFAELSTAHDGEEGLAHALKEHPDLILLDILMPKMDGITMLKKLREDEWGRSAKVIILTNFDTTDDMLKEITESEPAYYLLKSNWRIEDVIIKAKGILGLV